jgi:type II secretory pathway pseudopilin PulG
MKRRPFPGGAFTLVETVLALGIAAFALLTLVAAVSTGSQINRSSYEAAVASDLLTAVAADRQNSPLTAASLKYQIPPPTNSQSGSLTLGEDGTVTEVADARYVLSWTLEAPPSQSLGPALLHLRIAWPAQGAKNDGSAEILVALPQS